MMLLDLSVENECHPVDAVVLALRSFGMSLDALEADSGHLYVKSRAAPGVPRDVVLRALERITGVTAVVETDAFPGEAQRHLLASILDSSADPQLGAGLDGRIKVANEAAHALFNTRVIGADIRQLFGDARLQKGSMSDRIAASSHDVEVCGMPYLLVMRCATAEVNGTSVVVGGILTLYPRTVRTASDRGDSQAFSEILGCCRQINAMRTLASKFARSDAPLMIRGETGTGKELVALGSHKASPRRDAPFLALNCAAMPESLAESELFGYAPGAFSGANRSGKAGLLELAHRGTLFLDEIGEMSASLQAKLLRFLQDGGFMRVGASQMTKVDVRIITATHRNLEDMVEKGLFREDLLYRLHVLDLYVPALRHREEDVLLLAEHFLAQACEQQHRPRCRFSAGAVASLSSYRWPGNIRQLRNMIVRAVAATDGAVIARSDLFVPNSPAPADESVVESASRLEIGEWGSLSEAVATFEKEILASLFSKFPSSRLLASRLKVSHTTVATKLRKHGIRHRDITGDEAQVSAC